MKRTPGRKPTGLVHKLGITFMWDEAGLKLLQKRCAARKMSQAAYLRYAVEEEARREAGI